MRAMWSGHVSFGLISVPVKLYKATEDAEEVEFHKVHTADAARITLRAFCKGCGDGLAAADISRALCLPDGTNIILADDDLETLPRVTAKTIEVLHFAPASQVSPLLLDASYYAGPASAATNGAYGLLMAALKRTRKVAITRLSLRSRESLAILRPVDGALTLTTLHWAAQLRPATMPSLPQHAPRDADLSLACAIIEEMTQEFNPVAHTDGYTQAVAELAERKAAGALRKPATLPVAPQGMPDLGAALEASLAALQKARAKPARTRKTA